MLIQFLSYLSVEKIYFWTNFAVLPFWLMLIFIPRSRITQIFINSIILPAIFATIYVYLIYQAVLEEIHLAELFNLYLSLDNLYTLFSNEIFLLIFWLHFVMLNLLLGSWASNESIKNNIPRALILTSLILIYLTGPVGLVIFWFIRIFYAKKIKLYD